MNTDIQNLNFNFLSSPKKKKKKKSIIVFYLSPSPLSLSYIYIYIYYKIYSPLSFFLYSLCYWRAFTPQYYDKFLVFISLIFKSCYTRIQYNLFLFLLIPSCRFFFFFLSCLLFGLFFHNLKKVFIFIFFSIKAYICIK